MEDSDAEWESEESEEKRGNVSWILDKGLTLGKRILVTGIAISSAPVVLPQLVVVSAIAIACSVPYGLFLASYTCTEKLMSKLLPLPTFSPRSLEYDVEKAGESVDLVKEYGDIEYEPKGRIDPAEQVRNEIVKVNGFEEDIGEYMDEEEGETSKAVENKIEQIRKEEEQEAVINERRDGVDETGEVVIRIEGDERSSRYVKETFGVMSVVAVPCQGYHNKEGEGIVKKKRGLVEKLADLDEFDNGGIEGKRQRVENAHGAAEKGGQKIDKNGGKMDMPLGDATTGGNASMETVFKDADTLELTVPTMVNELECARVPSGKNTEIISNKVMCNEEKIWKAIDAMRRILGYTAAPNATCVEELRALYLFIGVEPPTSFDEPCDMVEVSDKLMFLMSIIGVN